MPFEKGNKFGRGGKRAKSGRKSLPVRQLCALEFTARVPILCEIADNADGDPKDRISAIKELARVGLPEQHEIAATMKFNQITFDGDKEASEDTGGG